MLGDKWQVSNTQWCWLCGTTEQATGLNAAAWLRAMFQKGARCVVKFELWILKIKNQVLYPWHHSLSVIWWFRKIDLMSFYYYEQNVSSEVEIQPGSRTLGGVLITLERSSKNTRSSQCVTKQQISYSRRPDKSFVCRNWLRIAFTVVSINPIE